MLTQITSSEHTYTALQSLRLLLEFDVREEQLTRIIPPDEFDDEMLVMAEIRSVFQVAYKVRLLTRV